jgi:hypothetical protein
MFKMFRPLNGLFEPSAIQQLTDGRFVVVEDEKDHPLSLLTIEGDGILKEALFPADDAVATTLGALADLEGLSADARGNVYAVTSHSRTSKGEEKRSREKLVRFRVEGNCITAAHTITNLKAALTTAYPVLAEAAAVVEVKAQQGLNIEALEMAPDGRRLYIGFRGPLWQERALLAALDNPDAAFAGEEPLRLAANLVTLDLDGQGLRSMAWVAALGGYLMVSGPVAREGEAFRLWFWAGPGEAAARPVGIDGLSGLAHCEGIATAAIGGRTGLILVSDDGDRDAGRPASFAWLEFSQIRIG